MERFEIHIRMADAKDWQRLASTKDEEKARAAFDALKAVDVHPVRLVCVVDTTVAEGFGH